jgi:enoyl-CoA hydratase/carnithine racemase
VPEVRVPEEIDAASAVKLRDDLRAAIEPARGPLVLRGGSTVFCRGVSLAAAAKAADPLASVQAVAEGLAALLLSPVPTIAVVEGPAVGGGVGLACACDHVLATPGASFAMPELLYGLVPVVIVPALRRRITVARLFALALSGAARPADEALDLGLCDEVVPARTLTARLERIERQFGRVDAAALAVLRAHVAHPAALRAELDEAARATAARLTNGTVRARLSAYLSDGTSPWERDR